MRIHTANEKAAPTRKGARRGRRLAASAWIVVIALYVFLGAAWLWPADFRSRSSAFVCTTWAVFMLRTFLFHIGLGVLVIAGVAALTRRWKLLLAGAALLVLTLAPDLRHYLPKSPPPIAGEPITVMSANLLSRNRNTAAFVAEIAAADPDVILLQEYSDHWHAALQSALAGEYPFVRHVARQDSFGAAIYSRLPFVGRVELFLGLSSWQLVQMRAVIEIDGQPVAFYNLHLLPPKSLGYVKSSRLQFVNLLRLLERESLPVILAGDFNFTLRSAQARTLRGSGFRDSHDLAGRGRGATWPARTPLRFAPGIQIDHIFLSRDLTCAQFRTLAPFGSDHRPIVAKTGFGASF